LTDGGEIEEAGERERGFVVAGGNSALVLEVPEHPLDAVTVPVSTEIAWNVVAPVGLWRDDRQDAAHQQVRSHRIAIVSFVRQQCLGFVDRQRHQVIDSPVIRSCAARQDEAERASLIVAAGVDFARKAAA
jgi:hypothetical protein